MEERRGEEGVRARACRASKQAAPAARGLDRDPSRTELVRGLDALAARAGRPRAARDASSIDAFLPTVTRWSRWKDRKKKIDWPLFPGYCFARFDPADALPILKCTGVVNIVSFDGKPAPIPEHEIDSIRAAGRKRAAVRSVPADSRRA